MSSPSAAARVPHQAVRAIVVPVRGVGRHGNDRRQSLDAGGRRRHGDGAVVGGADHADLAGRPGGAHFVGPGGRGVPLGATVEPIDHRLGCQFLRAIHQRSDSPARARFRGLGVHHGELRGTHMSTSELEMRFLVARKVISGSRGPLGRRLANFLLGCPRGLPRARGAREIRANYSRPPAP